MNSTLVCYSCSIHNVWIVNVQLQVIKSYGNIWYEGFFRHVVSMDVDTVVKILEYGKIHRGV